MTISEAWDRMFWSIMIVWIGLLEQAVGPCEGPGLIVSVTVGIAFFYRGWHNARTRKTSEDQAVDEDL